MMVHSRFAHPIVRKVYGRCKDGTFMVSPEISFIVEAKRSSAFAWIPGVHAQTILGPSGTRRWAGGAWVLFTRPRVKCGAETRKLRGGDGHPLNVRSRATAYGRDETLKRRPGQIQNGLSSRCCGPNLCSIDFPLQKQPVVTSVLDCMHGFWRWVGTMPSMWL